MNKQLILGRVAFFTLVTFFITLTSASAQVVINEIYGGGGNSGATFRNDFVELRNIGTSAIDLSGYSIQYASAAGTTFAPTVLTGTIQPNSFYLIALASGGAVGTPLDTLTTTPNATGASNLSATAGKVALVSSTTALTGSCPTSASIVDFVGYGGANCYENGSATPTNIGNTQAPSGSNTSSTARMGLADANINSTDFTVSNPPTPQNANVVTAAEAEVGGRVTQPNGRGVSDVKVIMTDFQGNERTAITNPFGYFRFTNVDSGQTYIFSASHRRYQFEQPLQVQFIGEDNGGINFIVSGGMLNSNPLFLK